MLPVAALNLPTYMPSDVQVFRTAPPKMWMWSIHYQRYTPYALYLLVVGIGWRGYDWRTGPDSISYVSIAQEYFAGHWWDAVNTFWSPLFSWMIAAGMATHIPAFTLARCLVVIWGLVGLAGIRSLTLHCGLPRDLTAGVAVIAAPMLASFAVTTASPDFIALCLLILYLSAICPSTSNDRQRWLVAGVLGALLYLCKAYMFGFVIAHLSVMTILRLWPAVNKFERRKILGNYVGALACLLVLSSPWLIVIAFKAGHPMLSATGSWNYAKARMDPEWFPQLTEGLFTPPTPTSVSIWEDPGRMHLPPWSPLASTESVRWQIYLVLRNSLYFLYFMLRASVFSIAIVPYFVWALWQRRWGRSFYSWSCLLSAYLIYPLGYILIALGEERYIWIESVLLLLMGACAVSVLRQHLTSWPRFVAIMTVLAGLSFWGDPIGSLIYHWGEGRDVSSLAESLRPLNLSGNVASNDQWGSSLYLCYTLGLHYYGIPKRQNIGAIEQDLRKNEVRYFLVWKDTTAPVSFERHLRQLLFHQLPTSEIPKAAASDENLNMILGDSPPVTISPQRSSVGPDAESQQANADPQPQVLTGDTVPLAAADSGVALAVRQKLRVYQVPWGNR